MGKPWVIIPCGSRKHSGETFAGYMYLGSYHRGCMKYALSLTTPKRVLILSAKHGLLRLDERIQPYELKMGSTGCVTTETVRQQGQAIGVGSRPILVLGKAYDKVARKVWPEAIAPLRDSSLGMGKQLQWMLRNRGILPDGQE